MSALNWLMIGLAAWSLAGLIAALALATVIRHADRVAAAKARQGASVVGSTGKSPAGLAPGLVAARTEQVARERF